MLVTELVPEAIEMLPIKQYVILRERYKPIREHLSAFVNEAVLENRLGHVEGSAELRQAGQGSVKELGKEIESFRESTVGRTFRRWAPCSLGGFITIAAAVASHPLVLPLAGASVLLAAVDRAGVRERKATKRSDMMRLIAAARKDILSSVENSHFQ